MNFLMNPQSSFRKKVIKPLASLKLAVFILLGLAVLVAIGTFIEAKYDAKAGRKIVYHTFWMFGLMSLLSINLTAVMIDRLPWKRHHMAFIFAHIGILILLAGSLVTWFYGLDGTMRIGIGESNRFVSVEATEINLYASFDGESYTSMLSDKDKPVDFFKNPPSPEKPHLISNLDEPLKVIGYERYVLPERKVVPVGESDRGVFGSGVRFQLFNANANDVDWIVQKRPTEAAIKSFGPALIHLGPVSRGIMPSGHPGTSDTERVNEAFITPQGDKEVLLTVFGKKDDVPLKKVVMKEGDVADLGWMDLQIRVLRYLPKAKEDWEIQVRETPTQLTTSAMKIQFQGKEHWVLLNDVLKLFTANTAYILTYGQRRVDLGFPIFLDHFEMEKYQGTNRAMAYKSFVKVPEAGEVEISMNEPMEYRGLIFYQASFQEDESGKPIASILSVNYDPGRWIKYLGSLVLSLGIVLLFWFKRMSFLGPKKTGV